MKKTWKVVLLTALLALCLMVTASAATASKVINKHTYSNGKESVTIWGKTKSGKTVWKYRSGKYTAAQCAIVTVRTKGNYVYVLEGRKYIRLSKKTGKILVKKTIHPKNGGWGGPVTLISSAGDLYAMNYLDTVVYRISKNGKIKWKRDLKDPCYWAYRMKLSNNTLTVYGESPNGWKATLNATNGTIKKRTLS
ncbi:MAG: hypothetical protein Q4F79_04045 [Eubacteriales bacterium]|nr:hypothetical protein [Eubacteriales bacterium]